MTFADEKHGYRIRIDRRRMEARVEILREGWGCTRVVRRPHTLIVAGEVFDDRGPVPPEDLLTRLTQPGLSSLDGLDGTFVLVLMTDGSSDVVVYTDPVNALKCFVEDTPDRIDVVSSLCFLESRPRALDRVAVVSFLCNGAVFNGRTMLDGVRLLPRAAVHRISPARGVQSSCYWGLHLDRSYGGRAEADLHAELAALVDDAVRRRTPPDDVIYLSLSGGYDSACILGALGGVGRTQVQAFSYAYLPAPGLDGTDANVAAASARVAGIPHTRVSSFHGDPLSVLRTNVDLGEGRANLCLEWDAWRQIHGLMPRDAVFVAGDEWVGDGCGGLDLGRARPSYEDILAAAFLRSSLGLQPYLPLFALGPEAAAFDEELLQTIGACGYADGIDIRSVLYVDCRIGCMLMPWRELFTGRWHRARHPLLDRRILAFTSHLSPAQRLDRCLFKRMAARRYPDLFAVPRTSQPDARPWPDVIQRSRAAFDAALRVPSPADDWLSPRACRALADQVATGPVRVLRNGPLAPWLLFLRAFTVRELATRHASYSGALDAA